MKTRPSPRIDLSKAVDNSVDCGMCERTFPSKDYFNIVEIPDDDLDGTTGSMYDPLPPNKLYICPYCWAKIPEQKKMEVRIVKLAKKKEFNLPPEKKPVKKVKRIKGGGLFK